MSPSPNPDDKFTIGLGVFLAIIAIALALPFIFMLKEQIRRRREAKVVHKVIKLGLDRVISELDASQHGYYSMEVNVQSANFTGSAQNYAR